MSNRDLWLAERLVDLAASADADDDAASPEAVLTAVLSELLAPAGVTVVLAGGAGSATIATASNSRIREVVSVDLRHHEGPATECVTQGAPLDAMPAGAMADRWPAFAAAAAREGLSVVSALPLRRQGRVVGAVIVLGTRQPSAAKLRDAQMLTEAAAVAITQRRGLRQRATAAGQLRRALDSRVLIEQAKGATAARLGITPEAAFSLLRAYARRKSRPLDDVSRQTMNGELPALELLAPQRAGERRPAAQPR
jgi:hypothetical protein